ncbi:MAG: DUF2855 family protein [Parvibaculum sp.]|uniref:DUF2855 family protein n=1 Tax=Parvibaculum sp. TaxID=2024848 RepID=UPI002ABA2373|nr:DUF2855 family protein [Parvibaculum sp.]MDZ4381654.1 DUF2855 family protein [Parvibaculum sp.]
MSIAIREFVVNRPNYGQTKWVDRMTEVESGQILVEIEKIALTANNITYAVAGDMLNYWSFFPAEEGWGKIPVWGFARIVQSKCEGFAVGERIYGYLPMATHLVMQPEKVTAGSFLDLYKQRRELHPVYNSYTRVTGARPHEDLEPVLRPLYTTSFLIDDWLADNEFFGAKQVLVLSASSKTGLGLAYGLHQRRPAGPEAVGLTSAGNKAFVDGLGYYDKAVTYGDVATLDASVPTAVVDFAGDGEVLAAVHRHFGDKIVESTTVGLSHKDAPRPPADLPGARPRFFFAPDQMKKRTDELGRDGFNRKLAENWNAFAEAADAWITVERSKGEDAIARVYADMLAGKINPAIGHILGFK